MSDWEVVEEALHRNGWRGDHTAYGGKNYALRGEGLAALARLREREADYAGYGEILESLTARAEAAEARVQELVESAREGWQAHADMEKLLDEAIDREKVLEARVEELEAALREIADPENDSSELRRIARRALEPRAEE